MLSPSQRELLREKARRAVGSSLARDPFKETENECWGDLEYYIRFLIVSELEAHLKAHGIEFTASPLD